MHGTNNIFKVKVHDMKGTWEVISELKLCVNVWRENLDVVFLLLYLPYENVPKCPLSWEMIWNVTRMCLSGGGACCENRPYLTVHQYVQPQCQWVENPVIRSLPTSAFNPLHLAHNSSEAESKYQKELNCKNCNRPLLAHITLGLVALYSAWAWLSLLSIPPQVFTHHLCHRPKSSLCRIDCWMFVASRSIQPSGSVSSRSGSHTGYMCVCQSN